MLNLSIRLLCIILLVLPIGCGKTIKEAVLVPPNVLQTPVKSITIGRFLGDVGDHGNLLADKIRDLLIAQKHINVVTRGGEATLTGTIIIERIERDSDSDTTTKTTEDKDGKETTTTTTTYYATVKARASVVYKLRRRRNILAGNSHETTFSDKETGSSLSDARSKLPTDNEIISNMLSDLAQDIVWDISPHKEHWEFTLQTSSLFGGNDLLDACADYYKEGLYYQAEAYCTKLIKSGDAKPKDIAGAYYNLGVLRMRQNRLAEAYGMFQQADKLHPGKTVYMKALKKAESAGLARQRMKKWK